MADSIDLRGLLCPEPVIRTKRLFDKGSQSVEALVDDQICVSNLQRLAKSLKASFAVESLSDHFKVSLSRAIDGQTTSGASELPTSQTEPLAASDQRNEQATVVFITKETLGQGDEDFGKSLLNIFLQTLYESGHYPRAILMANAGVRLMAKDSAFKKVLDDFRNAGCDVLTCGLCVDYYKLKDDVPKEQITNMFAICEYIAAASKVISP